MQYFYNRLVEERKNLKLTQDALAVELSISKRAYCNYEAGVSAPTVLQMGRLALLGFDVYYITTGERLHLKNYPTGGMSTPHFARQELLSEREHALLDDFRALGDKEKDMAETMLHAAAKSKIKKIG